MDQGPGHNTSPRDLVTTPPSALSRDLVTTPPPPGTWSQPPPFPPGPGHKTPLHPQDLVTTPPPRSGHNTPLPWDLVTTSPSPQDMVTTPPPIGILCAGGWYASYWNAFLFEFCIESGLSPTSQYPAPSPQFFLKTGSEFLLIITQKILVLSYS